MELKKLDTHSGHSLYLISIPEYIAAALRRVEFEKHLAKCKAIEAVRKVFVNNQGNAK